MGCVHLGACVPNFDVLECHALDVDRWDDVLAREDPLIPDGYIHVAEEPGLGVELARTWSRTTSPTARTGSAEGGRSRFRTPLPSSVKLSRSPILYIVM